MIPFIIPSNIQTLYTADNEGYTGYIDFITLDKMVEPIMRGSDKYKRCFIAIKMNIDNKKLFQTFFQRYTDSEGMWMGAGHYGWHIIETYGGMDAAQFKLIEDIIHDKIVKVNKEHRPNDIDFIDKYVCNEKIYNSIVKIQRAWRLCRYDPKYKMCETVQMNNLHDIIKEYE
jgi:hypothetical protein